MATMPVVVGVDGSEESLCAAEWAALEAKRHQAPLRIVSAPVLLPRVRVPAQAPETVTARLEHQSCRALDEAATRVRELTSDLLIDADLLTGAPARSLAECGSGALMLVVGAHGSGGFAAMLLGSVSRYAAMHASCPVVVVREETSAVHGEVAVGIRDPRDTAEALAFAFDEAARRGATLTAVHSWNWPPAADSERVAVEAGVHLAEALGAWRDKYPAVSAWGDLMRDHPAHVLASYSARSDLVVIGRHAGAGSRPAIGGVQHALLAHARGPVAIVPDAG